MSKLIPKCQPGGLVDRLNAGYGYTKGHLTDGKKAAVGLTYASNDENDPGYNEVVYQSPYSLPEVTAKAPDLRVAKAAREKEDFKPMADFMQDAVGSVGPWAPVYWGYKGAVGLKEGAPRTYNYAKNGEWGNAALSFGDNVLNTAMVIPGVSGSIKLGDRILGRISPAYNKVRAARGLARELEENIKIASELDREGLNHYIQQAGELSPVSTVTTGPIAGEASANTKSRVAPQMFQSKVTTPNSTVIESSKLREFRPVEADEAPVKDQLRRYRKGVEALNKWHVMPDLSGREAAILVESTKYPDKASLQETLKYLMRQRLMNASGDRSSAALDAAWLPSNDEILDAAVQKTSQELSNTLNALRTKSSNAGVSEKQWFKNYLQSPERKAAVEHWKDKYPSVTSMPSVSRMLKNIDEATVYIPGQRSPMFEHTAHPNLSTLFTKSANKYSLEDLQAVLDGTRTTDGATDQANGFIQLRDPKFITHELSHMSDKSQVRGPYEQAQSIQYPDLLSKIYGEYLDPQMYYLTTPTEVRARVMSLRNHMEKMGLNPNKLEDIEKMAQNPPTYEYGQLLDAHKGNKDFVHELIQYAPAAGVPIGLNYTFNPQVKQKQ